MKETIKKSFVWGLVFLLTIIIWWLTYAAVSNTITWWTTFTASMWNEMAGNYQYKLNEEVNTGKTWYDWKPIYRNIVSFTINTTDTWTSHYDTSSLWIITPISLEYIMNNNVWESTNTIGGWSDKSLAFNPTSINWDFGANYSWKIVYAIIEYTKTN